MNPSVCKHGKANGARMSCFPIICIHHEFDVLALGQRHPNLIKGLVAMGLSGE